MTKLTWKQTIKLGKKEVTSRLAALKIDFSHVKHYFKLCSLLYKAMKDNVVVLLSDMAASQTRTKKVLSLIDNVTSLYDHRYNKALAKGDVYEAAQACIDEIDSKVAVYEKAFN